MVGRRTPLPLTTYSYTVMNVYFMIFLQLWSPEHEDMENLYDDTETPYHLSESPPLSKKTSPTLDDDVKVNGRTE